MFPFQVSGNAGRLPAAGLHAVGGAPDARDADAASVVDVARSGAESSRLKGETYADCNSRQFRIMSIESAEYIYISFQSGFYPSETQHFPPLRLQS